jgi:hypothetical protein
MLHLDATSALVSLKEKQTSKYFDTNYQDILNYFVMIRPIDRENISAMVAELCTSANDTSEIVNFLTRLQFSYKSMYGNDQVYFRYYKKSYFYYLIYFNSIIGIRLFIKDNCR